MDKHEHEKLGRKKPRDRNNLDSQFTDRRNAKFVKFPDKIPRTVGTGRRELSRSLRGPVLPPWRDHLWLFFSRDGNLGSFLSFDSELAARMHENCNRRDNENRRKNYAAVAINFLGPLRLLVVIQDCRHQNFNQGKEDK